MYLKQAAKKDLNGHVSQLEMTLIKLENDAVMCL